MYQIGRYNQLEILRETEIGLYLDGAHLGDILLPKRYVPEGCKVGEDVEVFLYRDSEDRLLATTEKPLAISNTFAYLQVKDSNKFGAFLDWGLPKDLMVPFKEQNVTMITGQRYIVYIYVDENSGRLVASNKLGRFLEPAHGQIAVGDAVDCLVVSPNDLGFRVICNEQFSGLIFKNELFRQVSIGDRIKGFVKKIREDGKLDVSLQAQGYSNAIPDASQQILDYLRGNNNYMPITDDSSPELIYSTLQMSKKSFKKAVGGLYKQQLIQLEKEGIRLVTEE